MPVFFSLACTDHLVNSSSFVPICDTTQVSCIVDLFVEAFTLVWVPWLPPLF